MLQLLRFLLLIHLSLCLRMLCGLCEKSPALGLLVGEACREWAEGQRKEERDLGISFLAPAVRSLLAVMFFDYSLLLLYRSPSVPVGF